MDSINDEFDREMNKLGLILLAFLFFFLIIPCSYIAWDKWYYADYYLEQKMIAAKENYAFAKTIQSQNNICTITRITKKYGYIDLDCPKTTFQMNDQYKVQDNFFVGQRVKLTVVDHICWARFNNCLKLESADE